MIVNLTTMKLKKILIRLLIALCIFVYYTNAFGKTIRKYKEYLNEQRYLIFNQKCQEESIPNYCRQEPMEEEYITQPLDHFDAIETSTYKQRFWVNRDFWNPSNGPVFLYIGGEGPLNEYAVLYGHHVNMAKKLGALIFAVEHRFYGASINEDGLELENLKHLSSQQALSDLANFYLYAVSAYNLTAKNKWISFGGSYPGSLSAWIRLKYPHMIFGAVASSAPVEAVIDFRGYNEVVAASFGDPSVNGSAKCVNAIREAFATIDLLIANKSLRVLQSDFLSCSPLIGHLDAVTLVSNLAEMLMGVVQYNGEDPNCNISAVCQTMLSRDKTPYANLRALNQMYLKRHGQKCTDNSWSDVIDELNSTVIMEGNPTSVRQWFYQTCSQFGYYQTCESQTNCIFSKYMTLGSNLDICRLVFGLNENDVGNRIKFTNVYYGSNLPKGTRIIFVNGSIDPWHSLSVTKDEGGRAEIAIFIPGTAHCADMSNDLPTDNLAMRLARQKIESTIEIWLREARE